jgi:allantoin racemase
MRFPPTRSPQGFEVKVIEPAGFRARLTGSRADYLITEVATVAAAARAEAAVPMAYCLARWATSGGAPVGGRCSCYRMRTGERLTASGLGNRFSIATVWPESSAPSIARCLQQADLNSGALQSATSPRQRIVRELRAAVNDDGADVVVLGCCCMTPVASILAESIEAPLIDPTLTGSDSSRCSSHWGCDKAAPACFSPRRHVAVRGTFGLDFVGIVLR